MSPLIRRSRVAGLSLIELMVALLIAAFLMLGLVQIFTASSASARMSEGMARTQEGGRFAMDFLQRDLRMVGHFGCVNDQAHWVKERGDLTLHTGVGLAATHPLNFAFSVQGFEANGTSPGNAVQIGAPAGGWVPALPAQITALNPLPGSDVIVLRFLAPAGVPVTGIGGAAGAEQLQVSAGGWNSLTRDGVATPTLFGVADCAQADVFPGTSAAGGGGTLVTVSGANPATDLSSRYTAQPAGQTLIYRAEALVYYVAAGASGQPSLWRARANAAGNFANAEELVEGVESLQFLYGQDSVANLSATTPPVGNVTVQNTAQVLMSGLGTTALQANAWRRVGQVQVGILLSSPGRAGAQAPAAAASNPRVLGVEFRPAAANDGRYRASYEATVAVRNRLFGN